MNRSKQTSAASVLNLCAGLTLACAPQLASAQASSPPQAYAIIVGENQGGPGQSHLRFAQRDAQQLADVLAELGHVPEEHVRLLSGPNAAQLRQSFVALEPALREHARRGERTQLLFYYSGHARAEALNLGQETLPLSELRAALLALPATLKIVVLDACQSGAFSGIKGADPAADFSFNSVQRLDTEGMAVLASSSGTELSQESEALGASYFTHHLLVGLRGAGDRNRDGRVSLDEVYRYAYQNTLADTSLTAVGGQHVTLETALRGKGDVPLSYPNEARAHLRLPEAFEADVLVQQADAGSVMAEIHKAAGAAIELALVPGRYAVTLRRAKRVQRCPLSLADGASVEVGALSCKDVAASDVVSKGETARRRERWFLEAGLRLSGKREDAYNRRLETFSFERNDPGGLVLGGAATLGYQALPWLAGYVRYESLERGAYERDFSNRNLPPEHFSWRGHAVSAGVRGRWPLVREWLALYAQAGAGLSTVRSAYGGLDADGKTERSIERHYGAAFHGAIGFHGHVTHHIGAFFELGYGYDTALKNRVGDTHTSSAGYFLTGLRVRIGSKP